MKNTAYIKLALLLIGIAVISFFVYRYISNLPTAEEKTVMALVETFKRGNYDGCTQYCHNGTFFDVIDRSKIIDTDGGEINWKSYSHTWNEANLQASVETYVEMHLRKAEFISLSTQYLNDGREAVVSFLAELKVADYTTGDLLAPAVHEGQMEGKCFLKKDDGGEMKVDHFEVTLTSFTGLDLKKYLNWLGN